MPVFITVTNKLYLKNVALLITENNTLNTFKEILSKAESTKNIFTILYFHTLSFYLSFQTLPYTYIMQVFITRNQHCENIKNHATNQIIRTDNNILDQFYYNT